MKRWAVVGVLAAAWRLTGPTNAAAQDEQNFLAVGEMAPDIEVVGATRYGILADPVKLSDYRGETVVLAFFFRARTRG
jgi:peroxiredoxin Q/BCP